MFHLHPNLIVGQEYHVLQHINSKIREPDEGDNSDGEYESAAEEPSQNDSNNISGKNDHDEIATMNQQ